MLYLWWCCDGNDGIGGKGVMGVMAGRKLQRLEANLRWEGVSWFKSRFIFWYDMWCNEIFGVSFVIQLRKNLTWFRKNTTSDVAKDTTFLIPRYWNEFSWVTFHIKCSSLFAWSYPRSSAITPIIEIIWRTTVETNCQFDATSTTVFGLLRNARASCTTRSFTFSSVRLIRILLQGVYICLLYSVLAVSSSWWIGWLSVLFVLLDS
jgi:hypothetical protein